MQNLIKLGFLGVLLTSSLAQAGDHRDAARICESMSFSSSVTSCIAYLGSVKGKYFDEGAIGVCRSMSFDSGKNECIKNITGKKYEQYEISNCYSQSFDSDKNECLEFAGEHAKIKPPTPPAPPSYPESDYLPGGTAQWSNVGLFTAPKGLAERIEINMDSYRGVTEVRLAARNAPVLITKAYAITASGQHLELPALEGSVGTQGAKRVRLDARYAVRLQSLVIEATSPQWVGSRGQVEVVVGLTR